MPSQPAETSPHSAIVTGRSADEIRAWIVSELARSLNVDPASIDPAAPLHSLGADSLAAIGMTGALAGWLNRDLPATLMWDYGSIDAIAEDLADRDAPPTKAALPPGIIALQPDGNRLPLFCFPGMSGHPVTFTPMALHLAPTVPVYGVLVPGVNGEREPMTRLEDIAAAVLANIRLVQPAGPYQLAGYSFGGFLAYEVAQQLRAAGETVALLGVYDTFTTRGRRLRPHWQRWLLHTYHLMTTSGRRTYLRDRTRKLRRAVAKAKAAKRSPNDYSPAELHQERQWRFSQINRVAATSYKPLPYPGQVMLFRATEPPIYTVYHKIDPTNGWGAFVTGDVRVIDLPGGHETLLNPENALAAADALRPHLSDRPAR